MTCRIAFLSVENADCVVVSPKDPLIPTHVVDVPDPEVLFSWLEQNGVRTIDCLFITHAHDDHMAPLHSLADFIAKWKRKGHIRNLCIPREAIDRAIKQQQDFEKETDYKNNPTYRKTRATLEQLCAWDPSELRIFEIWSGSTEFQTGPLKVEVVFPAYTYDAIHRSRFQGKLNERSRVLRFVYGSFTALMLADIEGDGLEELTANCNDSALSATIVKIPHHGAWPKNGEDLKNLLARAKPRLAVLSVGSRNRYGHVVPELFSALIAQKNSSLDGTEFVCTEVTRTCMFDSAQRTRMDREGLGARMPCAGDIVIDAHDDGTYVRLGQAEHATRIGRDVKMPACLEKADLTPVARLARKRPPPTTSK